MDAPVAQKDRIISMDVLRGFAVLAIFVVNIKAMAMPFPYYGNAELWGSEIDKQIAIWQAYLVDNKWRTIFTALFGAGLVLIAEKSVHHGKSGAWRIVQRLFWLLLFGLVHLIGMWTGDILTSYALAGFIALLFRNMSVKALSWWAFGIMLVAFIWTTGFSMGPVFVPEVTAEVAPEFWGTDPERLQEMRDLGLAPVSEQISARAMDAVFMIGFYFFLGGFGLLTVGLMLVGMAMFKSGYLRGEKPLWVYALCTVLFLGIAFGIDHNRLGYIENEGWTVESAFLMTPIALLAGWAGAFGYASLIMILSKAKWVFYPFAAAGRMAFTNYIGCTLLATAWYGPFISGRFGSVTLQELMVFVGLTSVGLLVFSTVWLMLFRFGPLEWLWRSLTYRKLQPFMR
jgi:uncharacterized protein